MALTASIEADLRLGRGAGYRAALRAGAAHEVLSCVLHDPRWDRQLEARAPYYARLLVVLDADISLVAEWLLGERTTDDVSDLWLSIGVLAAMARRHHRHDRSPRVPAVPRTGLMAPRPTRGHDDAS